MNLSGAAGAGPLAAGVAVLAQAAFLPRYSVLGGVLNAYRPRATCAPSCSSWLSR